MRPINRISRPLLIAAVLLAGLAPALPAAQAASPAVPAQEPPPPPSAPAGEGPLYFPAELPTCAFGQYGTGQFSGQAIHDKTTITSTINIPVAGNYLWDIAVNTDIQHPFNSDLDIHLVSPAGTIVTLANHQGGGHPGNVFSGTTWMDQAAFFSSSGQPITHYPFTPGTPAQYLSPQEPFSALQGQPAAGDWSLVIHDGSTIDEGQLIDWGLTVYTLQANPHITTTTQFGDNSVQAIPDNGVITRNLNVAGVDSTIGGITLSTVITHPKPGGLRVYLVSPAGISITLSSNNGITNSNIFAGTLWTDKAGATNPPGAVTENTFAPGVVEKPLAPEEPLNELDGQPANGAWKVVVQDTAGDGQTGQLGPVKLGLQTMRCPPDLEPQVSAEPRAPRLGQPMNLLLTASNLGDTASNVVLTGTLPSLLTLHSVSGTGWSCLPVTPNSAGGLIQCTRPSLAANARAVVAVSVTAPLLPQSVPVTLTLGVAPAEVIIANNTTHPPVSFYAHSANGNPWDVELSDGDVTDGGQDAFDDWGRLRLVVLDNNGLDLGSSPLSGLGLVYSAGHRWTTTSPTSFHNIRVSRSLLAPLGADWLRYVDTFTNTGAVSETVFAAWGGNLGSDQWTVTTATSSGDTVLASNDRWAVTAQQDPPGTRAMDAVLGYAFRSAADTSYLGPVKSDDSIITTTWPSTGQDNLSHAFKFKLVPGASARLAYFVYHGVAEGTGSPGDCEYYSGCFVPAVGAQVTLVKNAVIALQANPYFCDLSPAERASLVNWPGIVEHCNFLPLTSR